MPQMGMHYALHSLNGGALSAKFREWRCTDRQHRPPCAKRAPSQELRRATCKPSSVRAEQRASRVAHMSSSVQAEWRTCRSSREPNSARAVLLLWVVKHLHPTSSNVRLLSEKQRCPHGASSLWSPQPFAVDKGQPWRPRAPPI